VDWNLGHFGHDGADRRPLRRSRLEFLFKQRARERNGSTMLTVFEVKKEISDNMPTRRNFLKGTAIGLPLEGWN